MTRAAKELQLSLSYVSKRIKFLEETLGTQLLIRSTRYLSLTEVGETYYRRCSEILSQLKTAHEEISDLTSGHRGTVRVYSAQGFGEHFLLPVANEFARLHPEIKVELNITAQSTSPTEKGVDITIRTAKLYDSSLECRKLGDIHYNVCAAPAYLNATSTPRSPSELSDLNCLVHTVQPSADRWTFNDGQETITVPVTGNLESNSGVVIARACFAGAGIARLPDYDTERGVQSGRVRVLFPGQLTFARTIYAYYPRTAYVPVRIESFIQFLQARMDDLTSRLRDHDKLHLLQKASRR